MAGDLPIQDALDALQSLYGLKGIAKPLPGELDANFYIQCDDGKEYVLKLHMPGFDADNLDFQDSAFEWLANKETGLPLPKLVLTSDSARNGRYQTSDGQDYTVRLLSWLDGKPWSKVTDRGDATFQLGAYLGKLDKAFEGLNHPAQDRHFLWDAKYAADLIPYVKDIQDDDLKILVGDILTHFKEDVSAKLAVLPKQVIHNDANDNNILLHDGGNIAGVIDFGDIIHAARVQELGVAGGYAMFGADDPIAELITLSKGYHAVNPLNEDEIALIYDLAVLRLAQSAAQAARQIAADPDNEYLLISQKDVSALIKRLSSVNRHIAHFQIRNALGLEPVPGAKDLRKWMRAQGPEFAELTNYPMKETCKSFFDLSDSSPDMIAFEAAGDTAGHTDYMFARMEDEGAKMGIGHYMENRVVYDTPAFEIPFSDERRTLHMGIDIFIKAEEPLYAPYAGSIIEVANRDFKGDYGPVVLMEHATETGQKFWTLYGHLSRRTLDHLKVGDELAAGDLLAWIGDFPHNGDWPPHVHFQIYTHLLDMGITIDGVAPLSMLPIWESISPDPNLLLGSPEGLRAKIPRNKDYLIAERQKRLSRTMSLAYSEPLKIVKGEGAYLYDETGQAWLDMVNNVCHVGHCHPRVVKAGQDQMAALNTNSRYLHDNLVEYTRRLLDTFPDELDTCFLVNSGSEANDLAMRIAKLHTGGTGAVVLDHAYHGHLSSMIDFSPYKFNGNGGQGKPDHVAVAKMPDGFRGEFKYSDPDHGVKYGDDVKRCLGELENSNHKPAVFYAESLLGVGGQHPLPPEYLKTVYKHIRAAGALCLADEVQVGFGRVGPDMWAFQLQDVVPDIVTLGKPIGNGHPMAAVVTKREIAESFVTGMEYFNTYGANPVSSAIGLAVLDVLQDERLPHNAVRQGERLMRGLRELQNRYPLIGDVRGVGLFTGAELVTNLDSLAPDEARAKAITEHMKGLHILLSTDGPDNNVLKMKPPICVTDSDMDCFLESLNRAFADIYGS